MYIKIDLLLVTKHARASAPITTALSIATEEERNIVAGDNAEMNDGYLALPTTKVKIDKVHFNAVDSDN